MQRARGTRISASAPLVCCTRRLTVVQLVSIETATMPVVVTVALHALKEGGGESAPHHNSGGGGASGNMRSRMPIPCYLFIRVRACKLQLHPVKRCNFKDVHGCSYMFCITVCSSVSAFACFVFTDVHVCGVLWFDNKLPASVHSNV